MNQTHDAIEAEVRAAWEARDHERAVALVIERYGPELLAFLTSLTRDAVVASDVFSEFSENLWRSWPRFEWRCSVRTWSYTLVRRTASHHRERNRKHEHNRTLTPPSQLSLAVERLRTATLAHRRTDVKNRFQELRAQLSEEDQSLLILRVDRGLSWLELAGIFLNDESASPELQKTEAARLRKRFQLAKERLRALVEQAGLLENSEG